MSGESKKEEFRKYLERSGVIDALTKVLVALYEEPEKPANALDFIKQYLGAPTSGDVETMKAEKDELMKKNEELTKNLEVIPPPTRMQHAVRFLPSRPSCCQHHRLPRPEMILENCRTDSFRELLCMDSFREGVGQTVFGRAPSRTNTPLSPASP